MATKNKVTTAKIAVSRAAKDQMLSLPKIKPPFPELLLSNTPPTDLEETEILKAISTVEAQYILLQEIIQDHGPDRTVEHQLDLARQFVHAHRVILSAIRRIPPEVLQEIFFQINLLLGDYRSRDTIPWALSQVCQRWRTTAISTTSLWNQLPAIRLSKKTPGSYVAQIDELLIRSRDAPISFNLYVPSEDSEHPMIDVLTRHSDRWQTVITTIFNFTVFASVRVKGQLSSLQTLSLVIWHDRVVVLDTFEDAPQLREVRLGGDFPGEIRLPFSQLTRYKEDVRGRGMVDHTISLATSLTTLEISRFSGSPDIPPTNLPFLVTLKVRFETFRGGFLDRLTLPAVQEIWIAAFVPNLIIDIIDMISRSHLPCKLKKFAFRVSGLSKLDSGELTRLLRLTPDLVSLDLSLPPLGDLANLVTGQHLVPLLQTLTIEGDARPETSQLLNEIAISRCNLQDSHMSAVPHLGDRQALEELRIIFKVHTMLPYKLTSLEGWVPSEKSEQLVLWKDKLLQELPELIRRSAPLKRRDFEWQDRVFNIFSKIEKFRLENVNDIYISGMHTILGRFTNQPATSILSQFENRAGKILEKWTPLFELHLKERRWVLKGDVSLVYLPIDDPLRLSLTGLDIVHGLRGNLQFSELFWPIHISHHAHQS